jgi:translation initiation factor IF-2
MGEIKLTRLNKILREFNISLDRAVEFLASNGHEIDARPTTKISPDQYTLFLNEFSSDKSSKVESHDLSEEKRKEKEELRIKLEKEFEEKEKKRNSFIERVEVKKPVHLGKIDLDKFNKPTSKDESVVKKDIVKPTEKIKNTTVEPQVENDKDNSSIKRREIHLLKELKLKNLFI